MARTKAVRKWLISDTKIAVIRSELMHMRQNMISTTDTETSYSTIVDILNNVQGVD